MFLISYVRLSETPTGLHGRGPKAGAPASDAVGRGDSAGMRQTARPCRVGPRRATWQGPNRADAAEVGADSAEIGADAAKIGSTRFVSAVSACIGRNGRVRPKFKKKKKKKVQTHRFTNLKTPRPLTFRPASLTLSLISLLCVTHCAPMKKHPSIPAVLRPSS